MDGQVTKRPVKVHSPGGRVSRAQAERFWRSLALAACSSSTPPVAVRLAAAVAITRATGARHGELVGIKDADIPPGGAFMLRRRPQGRRATNPLVERVGLDEQALAVLRCWRWMRTPLVERLEGGQVEALFVTVRASTDAQGRVLPAGVPIRVDGLELAYKAYVRRENARRAGLRGWVPMPTRYEALRLAWCSPATLGA